MHRVPSRQVLRGARGCLSKFMPTLPYQFQDTISTKRFVYSVWMQARLLWRSVPRWMPRMSCRHFQKCFGLRAMYAMFGRQVLCGDVRRDIRARCMPKLSGTFRLGSRQQQYRAVHMLSWVYIAWSGMHGLSSGQVQERTRAANVHRLQFRDLQWWRRADVYRFMLVLSAVCRIPTGQCLSRTMYLQGRV